MPSVCTKEFSEAIKHNIDGDNKKLKEIRRALKQSQEIPDLSVNRLLSGEPVGDRALAGAKLIASAEPFNVKINMPS